MNTLLAGFGAAELLIKPLPLAVAVVVTFAWIFGFDIYYESQRNGQTPGKRLAQIRVVREGGAAVDLRSACIRNLLGLVDLLPAFYLLGALLIQLTPRGRRLGDLAGGTVVVRERVTEQPEENLEWVNELATTEYSFTADQLRSCAPGDRHILRTFFQRLHAMKRDARQRLAFRLVEQFQAKTSFVILGLSHDYQRSVEFLATLYKEMNLAARHLD
jgi:hypothetical protein